MVDTVKQEDNLDNILAPVEQAEPIYIGASPLRPQPEPIPGSKTYDKEDSR